MTAALNEAIEAKRLQALHDLDILDTLPEASYQDLVQLAATICGTPVSAISLIDKDRQWFKAIVGINATQTSRDIAFCAHTITSDDIFEVQDASKDDRFAENPLVVGEANVQFYAGAPLILSDGIRLGALCVIDHVGRSLSESQKTSLAALARQVVAQFELTQKYKQLEESQRLLDKQKIMMDAVASNFPGALYRCILNKSGQLKMVYMSRGVSRFFSPETGVALNEGILSREMIHPLDIGTFEEAWIKSAKNLSMFNWEGRILGNTGISKWIRVISTPHLDNNVVTWDGVFLDIDYEKALEELVQQEKQISVQAMKAAAFGKLATGLAHEINNPLAIIKGLCFVIDKKSKAGDIDLSSLSKNLGSIGDNVDRITRIMTSLQGLSVTAQREMFETVAVGRVLQFAKELTIDKLNIHDIRIEIENPKNPPLRCRPQSLGRAVANLIVNACEAVAESKEKWIKVSVEPLKDDVKITVIDSGFGIDSQHASFIMDPFFTTKQIGEGNGLGLAITKAVAEDHAGTILYEPLDGRTAFVMQLPSSANKKAKVL